MPKLIKNGELVANPWTPVDADTVISDETLKNGGCVLSLEQFIDAAQGGKIDSSKVAVALNSDDDIEVLAPYLKDLPLISLDFKAFADGRSFSQARSLRDHFDYEGEIRATGSFIQDQFFYLSRCGVNAFLVEDDANIESMIESLRDFSESYQAACDEPQPLFRRRA